MKRLSRGLVFTLVIIELVLAYELYSEPKRLRDLDQMEQTDHTRYSVIKSFLTDSDGDGVDDDDDCCPNVPGLVSTGGCPDSDNDGIIDSQDKCPKTVGSDLNNGCPENSKTSDKGLLSAIHLIEFDSYAEHINEKSLKTLETVSKLLKHNKNYQIQLSLYADSKSDYSTPIEGLKKAKINKVKKRLLALRVDKERIKINSIVLNPEDKNKSALAGNVELEVIVK